jgi:hypothetical protein
MPAWAAAHFLKTENSAPERCGANVRNPRTAIANDQYIFIVVDNTSSDEPGGCRHDQDELGRFARDTLGATYGINQDGGGSSEMVVNGVIVNTPSDGLIHAPEAANTNALFLPMVGKGFQGSTWTPPDTGPKVERAVVNGLMMVIVEPKVQSSNYAAGFPVITLGETTLRLGPGSNYAGLTSLPAGSIGIVSTHNLNGVLARGSFWWKVDFSGSTGWVPEEAITH